VKELGILDADDPVDIVVEYETRPGEIVKRNIAVPVLGDNSYQVIAIDQDNVKRLNVELKHSGAVPFITFCRR